MPISVRGIIVNRISYSCCRFPQTQRLEMHRLVYIDIRTMPITMYMPIPSSKLPCQSDVALDIRIP